MLYVDAVFTCAARYPVCLQLTRPDKVRQVRVVTLLREYDYFKESENDADKLDDFSRYGEDEAETAADDFVFPPLLLDKPIIQQVVDFVRTARGRGVSEVQVRVA